MPFLIQLEFITAQNVLLVSLLQGIIIDPLVPGLLYLVYEAKSNPGSSTDCNSPLDRSIN